MWKNRLNLPLSSFLSLNTVSYDYNLLLHFTERKALRLPPLTSNCSCFQLLHDRLLLTKPVRPHQWYWPLLRLNFYTPIRGPPLAPAAVKLHDSSLLSPNSASHSDHVGLPNLVLPQELLVFPASLNVLVSRVSWRLWSWFVLQDVMVTQLDCGKSEVKIYSNYHNCMPILFLCRWSGSPDFTHALIHANFTAILRTSSLFPSPPTHDTLTSSSPHPRKPSSQYLPSLPQFSPTKE